MKGQGHSSFPELPQKKMNDIFRSLFGFPRREEPPGSSRYPFSGGGSYDDDNDDGDEDDAKHDDQHGEWSFHFGGSPFFGQGSPFGRDSEEDDVEITIHFSEPHEMFRHFEEQMSRQYEEMFRGLGMAEFPRIGQGERQGPPRDGTLRDKMLKRPDSERKKETDPNQGALMPKERSPIFEKLFRLPQWDRVRPEDKTDRDLDKEVSAADIEKLLRGNRPQERQPSGELQPTEPQVRSFGSFRSFSRVQGPDGRVEERRTVKDSKGNEESTITRIIGDQSHSVTTKKDKSGAEEKIENLQNLDEGEKKSFDQKWNTTETQNIQPSDPNQLLKLSEGIMDHGTESIFKNMFGFTFPRFGKT